MKCLCLAVLGLVAQLVSYAEEVSYEEREKIEAKYRVGHAELIKKADRVEVYLVSFDVFTSEDNGPEGNSEKRIMVAPYDKTTEILSTKVVGGEDRKKLLVALGDQIAKPEQMGGALCHYPIHGIRVYSGDVLLHEGTFCWVCGNFSFSYQDGAGWLDTTAELNGIFTSLMPIPKKELERFYNAHPGARPKPREGHEGKEK
ncbi:MAG: hypothetical protein ACSHX6_07830 [Akkermansiaceae bacterium]